MAGFPPAQLLAIWEHGSGETPAERAATLLAALPGARADLDVGSRDVLLAGLLAETAGPLVWAQAACRSCGSALDVPVDVAAVAALPVRAPGELLRVEVDGAVVRFRLPTSDDLVAVRGLPPHSARDLLLRRCLAVGDAAGDGPDDVSEAVATAVDAAMEEAAPAGAIDLLVACPDCATTTAAALDVSVLLWAEVQARAAALVAEVHELAAAYGWTEPDVLALSPRRRAAYLELVRS